MSKALFHKLSKFQSFQHHFTKRSEVYSIKQHIPSNKEVIYYPFINLIRFVSMIGIVWLHSNYNAGYENEKTFLNTVGHVNLYIGFIQIFKFGTICFFLISGFLLGGKIKSGNLVDYYTRRIKSTLKPYTIVFLIFVVICCFRLYVLHRNLQEFPNHSLTDIISYCLFDSHLWFIPNYLIALLVILIFSKFINESWYGGILFTLTALYSILIVYTVRFHANHSTALLGYVFYLWLGYYIRNNALLLERIQSTKVLPFIIILLSIFVLSCIESYKLYQKELDCWNTLRFGNQLYSITMFAFLIRIGNNVQKFGWFNPKKETYGIYLYHGILAWYVMPVSLNYLTTHKIFNNVTSDIYTYMIYRTINFCIIYFTATFIVKMLLKYNFGYLQDIKKA